MLTILICTVTIAIVVSAMCSLLEASLYSLRLSHIEVMAKTRPRTAGLLKKLKTNIDEPITAILTLNTIANTIGAAIAGAAAAAVLGRGNLVWFSLAFTLAILIFSEILPKTAGVVYARHLGPFIASPLQWMIFILWPFIWLCRIVTLLIPHKGTPIRISAEELQAIAIISRKTGEIEAEQEQVITNILQLGEQNVRQVMTPRTVTFSLDSAMTIEEAAAFREQWKIHSRAPVYSEDTDNVVGIVLGREIYMAMAEGQSSMKLSQIMHKAHFVPETAPLNRVLMDFFERYQHLFIVVDEYGSVTGVISLEDIIEEIVGREIIDESDTARDMRELARSRKKGMVLNPAAPGQKTEDR
ncbi:MAG: hemolysin family protein [Desulfobulbaceae bacterium]|nr:hemolysin family protein [Desulfobulbaceae bacterium]